MGIAYLQPWPTSFVRSELGLSSSLSTVLHHVAYRDAYPPLVHLAVWSLRAAPHPLLAARAAFVILSLALIGVVYAYGQTQMDPEAAAVLTAYVARSPLLASTGQELKWYAVAPLAATVATLLLLEASPRRAAFWAGYVLAVVLLVHLHYFGAWIVPAHVLFVWRCRRTLWRPFALALAAIALL